MSNFPAEEIRYVVGIDLGTTNSVVAYIDLKEPSPRHISILDIPQLIAPEKMGRRSVLPSFLYLPGLYELPPGSTALPWDRDRDYIVGEFAREQGARVPGRLVSSAKSWLAHGGVDRTAAILPWGAGGDGRKVSPVEAGARYLQHMREAWNESLGRQEGCRLEEQIVVLTVPASFDEVARELTVKAATQGGLPRVVLLEEPLAAFYAWLSRHERDWQETMEEGQLILVCDIGGGTTDFTILAVRRGEKGLRFDRLAVGEHLILGGDNMDLALARRIESQLPGAGRKQLDSKVWHELWHRCRQAKETLLSPAAEESGKTSVDITLMGSGGNVIGGMLKSTLTAGQVKELIIEGFFPFVSPEDFPEGSRRRGLTEMGLPYVHDPGVTRHLAAFWNRFLPLLGKETGRSSLFPEFLLFNGGALTPPSIRRRLTDVMQRWFQGEAGAGWTPVELENLHPELAVAEGAAYYGLVRRGEGIRVGAGSPRSYYVEVGGEGIGAEGKRAVCLVPRGTEEGFTGELTQPDFQVITNRPVSFQIYTSSTRLGDRMGDVVRLEENEATLLPPVRTLLRYGKKGAARPLPIQLRIHFTEIGILELWCEARQTSHRWRLQFDIRQEAESQEASPGETLDAALIDLACTKIQSVFQGKASHSPEGLVKGLVSILDAGKETWSFVLIRRLADTLFEYRQGRAISPRHEARWLNLTGFCLRPGFGDPLDEWRIREGWKLYPQGLHFPREGQGRSEWWIFWRRIGGGLSAGQQWQIYQNVFPGLQPAEGGKKKVQAKAWRGHEELEIWMMLANLERLPAAAKEEMGAMILEKIRKGKARPQEFWALGRFGARISFYGPMDQVISSRTAGRWLNDLLSLPLPATPVLAQALVQLARRTGDREKDLPSEDRDRLSQWLEPLPQAERLRRVISEPEISLGKEEQQQIFGESLPPGLILSG
jgi:molecular chaperone DnaK (HSP70)